MILFTNVLEPAVLRISRDPVTVRAEWGKVGKTRRDRIFKVNPPTLFTTATWEFSINMLKHQQTYETNIELYFIKNARALLLGITYRFAGTWIERKYPGKVQACVKRKSSNVLLKNIARNFSNHSRFYLIYTTNITFRLRLSVQTCVNRIFIYSLTKYIYFYDLILILATLWILRHLASIKQDLHE